MTSTSAGAWTASLVIPGVPPGTFVLRVRARNGAGLSGPSNMQAIGPGACTAVPDPATGFTIAKLGGLSVRLERTAPISANPATGYIVQATLDANFGSIVFNHPLATTATRFDAIAPVGAFFVRIIATNACGSAPPSNVVNLVMP